jgi:hypothetical protein
VAKYCIGFLFVICIPILTMILRKEIRYQQPKNVFFVTDAAEE